MEETAMPECILEAENQQRGLVNDPIVIGSEKSSQRPRRPFLPNPDLNLDRSAFGVKTHDGVFSNLSAKPELLKLPTHENPPTYSCEHHLDAPEVGDISNDDIDELEYDGLEVGGYTILILYCCVSFIFQWTGFLLTFVFSYSHAARLGSFIGLGCTMIVYSTSIGSLIAERNGNDVAQLASFLLACAGYSVIVIGIIKYRRIRQETRDLSRIGY